VDAATLAMFPTALNAVVQRLIGDVEQAAQIIALDRVFVSCDDFRVILAGIHQAGNTLKVLLVRRSRLARAGMARARSGSSVSDSHCHITSD
jgi:hypothetical protein